MSTNETYFNKQSSGSDIGQVSKRGLSFHFILFSDGSKQASLRGAGFVVEENDSRGGRDCTQLAGR